MVSWRTKPEQSITAPWTEREGLFDEVIHPTKTECVSKYKLLVRGIVLWPLWVEATRTKVRRDMDISNWCPSLTSGTSAMLLTRWARALEKLFTLRRWWFVLWYTLSTSSSRQWTGRCWCHGYVLFAVRWVAASIQDLKRDLKEIMNFKEELKQLLTNVTSHPSFDVLMLKVWNKLNGWFLTSSGYPTRSSSNVAVDEAVLPHSSNDLIIVVINCNNCLVGLFELNGNQNHRSNEGQEVKIWLLSSVVQSQDQ